MKESAVIQSGITCGLLSIYLDSFSVPSSLNGHWISCDCQPRFNLTFSPVQWSLLKRSVASIRNKNPASRTECLQQQGLTWWMALISRHKRRKTETWVKVSLHSQTSVPDDGIAVSKNQTCTSIDAADGKRNFVPFTRREKYLLLRRAVLCLNAISMRHKICNNNDLAR
jgi:hypothetical protein